MCFVMQVCLTVYMNVINIILIAMHALLYSTLYIYSMNLLLYCICSYSS